MTYDAARTDDEIYQLRDRAERAAAENRELRERLAKNERRIVFEELPIADTAQELRELRERLAEAEELLRLIRTRGWWAKEIDAFLARSSEGNTEDG